MAGQFVVNGTQTTVTFTYTALTTKVLATVNDAVAYLYPAIFGEVLDGSYLIAFSGVCLGAAGKVLDVWLRVNDADVANSNTIYAFKTTGVAGLVAVTFIQHFAAGDYFEFWTWGDSTNNKWDATAAGINPTRPACPSIIITANYVGKD